MKPHGFMKINKKLSLRVSLERCLHCSVKCGKRKELPEVSQEDNLAYLFIIGFWLQKNVLGNFKWLRKDGKKMLNDHFILLPS